jgi:hypothetical protein
MIDCVWSVRLDPLEGVDRERRAGERKPRGVGDCDGPTGPACDGAAAGPDPAVRGSSVWIGFDLDPLVGVTDYLWSVRPDPLDSVDRERRRRGDRRTQRSALRMERRADDLLDGRRVVLLEVL